ncbi:HTRA2-related serine protease isoform X2 [Temnothorax americanus]|uniref:HTRA2-related serine protease isoform X2 n=1 Tax=Temnothorax americanus TaxID=1964332 RepID=UPI004067ED33
MASPWSRMPWTRWTSLAKASSSRCVSRLATLVFAERHAGIRTFHSYQQQQQQQRQQQCGQGFGFGGGGARKLLTCAAFVSAAGLGYALYNWRDYVRQGIEGLNRSVVPNCPVVHAHPPSDGGQNRDKYNFIADVVEVTASAVVYIEIWHNNTIDIFTKKPVTTNGSGFIVSQDGLILTNAHVVENNKPNTTVKVRLYDGSTYTGIIEDIDLKTDLATVRINKTNLPVMKLGCSANIRPGEFVVAIGSPLTLSNTITSGIVSSVNRQSQEIGINNRHMGYIQTDAAINSGNSGGPLMNLNGEAIGINAMKVTAGISFAIPIDDAKEFLKKAELNRKNKNVTLREAPRRYIGVTMYTLPPEFLYGLQHNNNEYVNIQHGVLIWKVIPGSPAFCAGLVPGDIVTHANGEPMLDSNTLYKMIEQPGTMKLQILRKGKVLAIQVKPENIYY